MNKFFDETYILEWMTKGKIPTKELPRQQQKTHDVPTDDVQNTNGTN